jgi:hypothetical protein
MGEKHCRVIEGQCLSWHVTSPALLRLSLGRHKARAWPCNRLADRLGIGVVFLLALVM